MKITMLKWLAAAAAAGAWPVHAGPMGFKDSWMAMGDVGPNWREGWVNYALTARDAVGVGGLYMRSDDKRTHRELAELTYTRLLQRWNTKDSQANVWLLFGTGGVQGNDFSGTKTMLSPGIQLDYETTRVYISAAGRLYRASGIKHDYGSVRAGFSFYEADYEETQPWLIVEARRMRGLSDKLEITPMLRFISKGYFIEAGINNSRQFRFNFMKKLFMIGMLAWSLSSGMSLAAVQTIRAEVNGMVCAFCAQGIEKKMRSLSQTKDVYVDLKNKVVAVELKDGQKLSHDTVRDLIKDAGYDVSKIETVDATAQQSNNGRRRSKQTRLGAVAVRQRRHPCVLRLAGAAGGARRGCGFVQRDCGVSANRVVVGI
jgi:copper chaperone CopZ